MELDEQVILYKYSGVTENKLKLMFKKKQQTGDFKRIILLNFDRGKEGEGEN